MNIAILAENFVFGGINRYCLDLAEGLRAYPDANVSLLALEDRRSQWLPQEAAARGMPIEVLPMRSVFDFQVIQTLRHLLVERQVDVLHSQGYRSNMIARLAVRLARLPTKLICTVHGAYHFSEEPLQTRLYFVLDYLLLFTANRLIAVSEATRRKLARWGLRSKTQVIYNGTAVPQPVDPQARPAGRQALGIPPGARVVIFVGRLHPQKGIPTLVEVMRQTLSTMSDVVFLVVGDGPLMPDLQICAQEFGSRMILTGSQRDVAPFYAVADVVFLPSRAEGLPMVLIEAFAHGLPAVASDVDGIPEVVQDGINGFLCHPTDVARMHERLVQLLGDVALRRSLGVQARSTAEARFSLDHMILETWQVYGSLVSTGAA